MISKERLAQSMRLMLDRPKLGDLVIAGDAVHYASTLDDRLFPVFADDPDAQAASADRLAELRDAGAVIRPGHDPELLRPGPVPSS